MSLSGVLPLLQRRREFLFVSEEIERRRHPWVTGPAGSAKACLIAACVAHAGPARRRGLSSPRAVTRRRSSPTTCRRFSPPGPRGPRARRRGTRISPEDRPSVEAEGARQRLLEAVRRGDAGRRGGRAPRACCRRSPIPTGAAGTRVALRVGERRCGLRTWRRAWRRAATSASTSCGVPGQMAVRGGLIDVFPSTDDRPRPHRVGRRRGRVGPRLRSRHAADRVRARRDHRAGRARSRDSTDRRCPRRSRMRCACWTNPRSSSARPAPSTITPPPRTGARSRPSRSPRTSPLPLVPVGARREGARRARGAAVDAPPAAGRGGGVRLPGGGVVRRPDGRARSAHPPVARRQAAASSWRAGRATGWRSSSRSTRSRTRCSDGIGRRARSRTRARRSPPAHRGVRARRSRPSSPTARSSAGTGGAKKLRWMRDGSRLGSWTELAPGDLVVHIHHGIGLYRGLERLAIGDGERDYLHLEYAQGDTLYVPTDQINARPAVRRRRQPDAADQPARRHRVGTREAPRARAHARDGAGAAAAVRGARARRRARVLAGHAVAARDGGRVPVRGDARPAPGDRGREARHGERRVRWIAWCAATWATARPRSRCARRSRR